MVGTDNFSLKAIVYARDDLDKRRAQYMKQVEVIDKSWENFNSKSTPELIQQDLFGGLRIQIGDVEIGFNPVSIFADSEYRDMLGIKGKYFASRDATEALSNIINKYNNK